MSTKAASVVINVDTARFDKAFRDIQASFRATGHAMLILGKHARLLNRDMIRAARRPALIHNGRKPR